MDSFRDQILPKMYMKFGLIMMRVALKADKATAHIWEFQLSTSFRIFAISWSYELRFRQIKACWKEDSKIYNSRKVLNQNL